MDLLLSGAILMIGSVVLAWRLDRRARLRARLAKYRAAREE